MPNTIITPEIVAREALMVLRNNAVMANLVHRDYESEFVSAVGDTITVRKPAAFTAKEFASILKKLLILCIMAVAHIVDSGVLRALTVGFLLANECISVLENASRCGIPFPKKLIAVLEQLRDSKADGGNPTDGDKV